MKKHQPGSRGSQSGFSLVEMLVVVAVLTIIVGVVFGDLIRVQQRYRTEESKLDLTQESREFLDEIARDVHQAGYPNANMYALNVLGGPAANDSHNAVGLVSISATDLWFEGDVDANGQVDSVRYTLQADANGKCPCTLRRSQITKANGVAPMAQTVTYTTEVQNVINSNSSYPIAGTSYFNGATVNNDTLYAGFKTAPVFTAYSANGGVVTLPVDISTQAGVNVMRTIKQIQINLNVLAPYNDLKTGLKPAVAMTSTARLNN